MLRVRGIITIFLLRLAPPFMGLLAGDEEELVVSEELVSDIYIIKKEKRKSNKSDCLFITQDQNKKDQDC